MNTLKFISITLTLFFCMCLPAQNTPFRFGINTGINFSNATIDNTNKAGSSFRTGFQVGTTVDYAISTNMKILSGLSFITKGSQIDNLDYESYVGDIPDFTHKFEQQYIQLPLYGAYQINWHRDVYIMFGVGPYFAYGIGGKSKKILNKGVYADGTSERAFNTFGKNNEYPFDKLKKFDFGLGALANIEYKKTVLTIGYDYGLTNISNNDSYNYRNYSLTFSIGYKY